MRRTFPLNMFHFLFTPLKVSTWNNTYGNHPHIYSKLLKLPNVKICLWECVFGFLVATITFYLNWRCAGEGETRDLNSILGMKFTFARFPIHSMVEILALWENWCNTHFPEIYLKISRIALHTKAVDRPTCLDMGVLALPYCHSHRIDPSFSKWAY